MKPPKRAYAYVPMNAHLVYGVHGTHLAARLADRVAEKG